MAVIRSAATGTLSMEAVRVIALGAAVGGLPPNERCQRFEIDPMLVADVDARVPARRPGALPAQVRRAIHDGSFVGDASLATVAKHRQMSPRTLQRQLHGEDHSFAPAPGS